MATIVLSQKDKVFIPIIAGLSVAVAVAVAVLFYLPSKGSLDVGFLPHLNAVLNTATSIALVLGFYFVRKQDIKMHRLVMLSAFLLSTVFLVCYVIYHGNSESTRFPKDHPWKYLYYFILLTHI
ncbi:MAG TPA: DUF420 domain-containing protein, partial [Cytophagales bacterium]|nr:DUF420 domain-containing protein [Cytophagales bacterium]